MISKFISIACLCFLITIKASEGVQYGKCEFAQILAQNGVPNEQIPIWVCLGWHHSRLNTGFMSPGTPNGHREYGIFQVSSLYWCLNPFNPGASYYCNVYCSDLTNDDVKDDIECAQVIHRRQGFSAWYAWVYCKNGRANSFVEGCSY